MNTVYLITNAMTGKIYVGQTNRSIDLRLKEHIKLAATGRPYYLLHSIRKHGGEAFTIKELATTETREWSNYLEKVWIQVLGTTHPDIGYNGTKGGDGFAVGERNPKFGGNKGSDNPRFGKPCSDDLKDKLSKIFTGRTHTEETKKKISEIVRLRGKRTKPYTPEQLERMSKAQPVQVFDEEKRRKISEGVKLAYATGKRKKPTEPVSEEARANMSAAGKIRWARVRAEKELVAQ